MTDVLIKEDLIDSPLLIIKENINCGNFSNKDKFNFFLPFIPKEIYSLNNITILKDINKVRIYRTERSLSSLKTEISLDDQLTDNDIKKSKQDIETKIVLIPPLIFCIGTDK